MKIDLSKNEVRIVLKALRNRTEDLTRFADDAELNGHRDTMVEFLEMANDNDAVLEKIEKAYESIFGES